MTETEKKLADLLVGDRVFIHNLYKEDARRLTKQVDEIVDDKDLQNLLRGRAARSEGIATQILELDKQITDEFIEALERDNQTIDEFHNTLELDN